MLKVSAISIAAVPNLKGEAGSKVTGRHSLSYLLVRLTAETTR